MIKIEQGEYETFGRVAMRAFEIAVIIAGVQGIKWATEKHYDGFMCDYAGYASAAFSGTHYGDHWTESIILSMADFQLSDEQIREKHGKLWVEERQKAQELEDKAQALRDADQRKRDLLELARLADRLGIKLSETIG